MRRTDASARTAHLVEAAAHGARHAYDQLRAKQQGASFAGLFFVAVDLGQPTGRDAGVALLMHMEQPHPREDAERAVDERIAACKSPADLAMVATVVKHDGLMALLAAARRVDAKGIVDSVAREAKDDELPVIVISESVHASKIGPRDAPDRSKLN